MNARPDDFENLMREKLGDYQQEPPEGVWDNILAGIPGSEKRVVPFFVWKRLWIPLAASIVLIASGLWMASLFDHPETVTEKALRPAPLTGLSLRTADASAPGASTTSLSPVNTRQEALPLRTEAREQGAAQPASTLANTRSINPSATNLINNKLLPQTVNSEESFALANTSALSTDLTSSTQAERVLGIQRIGSRDLQWTQTTPENLSALSSRQTRKLSRNWQYARPLHYFVGMHYTPGWLVQRETNQFTQGVALSAGLEIHHLILESGLGVDFQKTQNLALVTYLTSDSIFHKESKTATTRYTLLNIPLTLGYRWNLHNWALTLKGGGAYHVQVRKHQDELVPSIENVLSFNVFDRTQSRSNAWISLMAATEVEYYVHEKLSLSLQPWFRYALLDLNTNQSTTRLDQHAAGLNAGLKIHL